MPNHSIFMYTRTFQILIYRIQPTIWFQHTVTFYSVDKKIWVFEPTVTYTYQFHQVYCGVRRSVAVSTLGPTLLVFTDPGVKIIGAYYRDFLLEQHLLPVIRNLVPEGCFIFQQDSAPARRARETIEMWKETHHTSFLPYYGFQTVHIWILKCGAWCKSRSTIRQSLM